MKQFILIFSILLLGASTLFAQKQLTRTGKIVFLSETPVENIEAVHNQVTSIFNTENGDLVFSLLMKGFQFEKELMQEHFNEKYVESDKFPKSTFKGSISNIADVDLSKDGTYPVKVEGSLIIHGVTQPVSVDGTLTIKGENITAEATFPVVLADYKVEIPSVVRDNIAQEVSIHVLMNYEPFKKSGK
ncbi:MAG: YceI family protein [Bacteroidota bacterium]